MTTNQHPITPSPEQVDQWFADAIRLNITPKYYIARQAALWSADQELEACCEVMRVNGDYVSDGVLRAIRRPKLLSDKEQALNALSLIMSRQKGMFDGKPFETIRQALEALPND
jgi:hypothetical protein